MKKNHLLIFLLLTLTLASCQKTQTCRVLQLNIWQEGTKVEGGYNAIVQQIIDSKADIVLLSEVRNYNSTRFCDRIVKSLAEKGKTFYSFHSYDSGILSRYPIIDSVHTFPEKGDHGSIQKAVVRINNHEIAAYSAHLDYLNCAYYMVKGYDGNTWAKYDTPFTDVDSILKVNMASERDDAIHTFLASAEQDKKAGRIIILGGDFNEPSHLDWIESTGNMFERQELTIPWTVSTILTEAGYTDAYRQAYPDPVTHPGITYPAYNPEATMKMLTWAPDSDERERIDFVYYLPSPHLTLNEITIYGPASSVSHSTQAHEDSNDQFDMGEGIWPSDHKGILATFSIK